MCNYTRVSRVKMLLHNFQYSIGNYSKLACCIRICYLHSIFDAAYVTKVTVCVKVLLYSFSIFVSLAVTSRAMQAMPKYDFYKLFDVVYMVK